MQNKHKYCVFVISSLRSYICWCSCVEEMNKPLDKGCSLLSSHKSDDDMNSTVSENSKEETQQYELGKCNVVRSNKKCKKTAYHQHNSVPTDSSICRVPSCHETQVHADLPNKHNKLRLCAKHLDMHKNRQALTTDGKRMCSKCRKTFAADSFDVTQSGKISKRCIQCSSYGRLTKFVVDPHASVTTVKGICNAQYCRYERDTDTLYCSFHSTADAREEGYWQGEFCRTCPKCAVPMPVNEFVQKRGSKNSKNNVCLYCALQRRSPSKLKVHVCVVPHCKQSVANWCAFGATRYLCVMHRDRNTKGVMEMWDDKAWKFCHRCRIISEAKQFETECGFLPTCVSCRKNPSVLTKKL